MNKIKDYPYSYILNVNDLQDDILLKSVLCTNTPSNGNLTENIKKVIFVSECKY